MIAPNSHDAPGAALLRSRGGSWPRAVLLDIGDTLIGPRRSFGEVYREVLSHLGISGSPHDFERAMRATWLRVSAAHRPGVDRYALHDGRDDGFWRSFVAGVVAALGVLESREELVHEATSRLRAHFASATAWEVFPDVVPALQAWRDGGIKLAVVSNWDGRLPALLDALSLSEFFDAVAVSHLEGVEKPSPRLFAIALARLGVEARDALHVGDVPELDYAGARGAGCAVRLIDRRGRLPRAWRAAASLADL